MIASELLKSGRSSIKSRVPTRIKRRTEIHTKAFIVAKKQAVVSDSEKASLVKSD